jgi:hypothetical protein
MSYMHINNLYKDQEILLFKECYALEKIHGTSAHISWKEDKINLFAGGADHEQYSKLFNMEVLSKFVTVAPTVIYGEAYGGKCQGMSKVYGKELKFVAFEVKIGDAWLNVPNAEEVARSLGLDFVHYVKISCNIKDIDAQRDAPSVQASKNGIIFPLHTREGIVLRPLIELTKNNGERIIAKHKNEIYKETNTSRELSADRLKVLSDSTSVADEWVTHMRLTHVLQSLNREVNIEDTRDVMNAMLEDVLREGDQEIVDSNEVRKAIGRKTVMIFKTYLQNKIE